jgi:predicted membrane protein
MNKRTFKTLFWIFGLVFTGMIYYLIFNYSSFQYIKESIFLTYSILLVCLILFFILGNIVSNYPILWSFKLRSKKLGTVVSEIEVKKKEEELEYLVKKIKQTLSYLSNEKYSDFSINYLMQTVGISKENAQNILLNIRKLKRLRTISIILGMLISIFIYFFVSSIASLENISKVILISSSIIVFLLFVLEGYLVTRMPNSFYLNLLNINQKKIIDSQKERVNKFSQLKNFNLKQDEFLNTIKDSVKFLLNQNISKSDIIDFFKKYNVNENIISQLIISAEKEILPENKIKIKSDSAIKLSLKNIEDNLKKIKEISQQVTNLEKQVIEISNKQKKLESLSSIDLSKEIKKLKKDPIVQNKIKGSGSEKVDLNKIKNLINDKSQDYEKLINYLYHLFLPLAETSSKNDVFSTLVYYGYPYEVIEDLLQRFKDKDVTFAKDKKFTLTERIVNKINNFYEFFSK